MTKAPGEPATPTRRSRFAVALGLILVAAIALFAVYVTFGTLPLEEPPSSIKTPNPSKAPWYMLGPQEWLVYYDPWLAGVLPPILVMAAWVLGPIAVALTILLMRRAARRVMNERR